MYRIEAVLRYSTSLQVIKLSWCNPVTDPMIEYEIVFSVESDGFPYPSLLSKGTKKDRGYACCVSCQRLFSVLVTSY